MTAASEGHTGHLVRRGLAWIGAASSLVSLLDLTTTFILLNVFLTREELGIATLAMSLFPVLDIATDLGIMSAVIQREDHTIEKISTVFWVNVAASVVMLGVLALVAPIVAHIHGYPVVGTMLLVYGGKLVFQNCYTLPQAMMKRELRFKELSIIRVIANLAEAIGKIALAAAGVGVWVFVLGGFCRILVTAIGVNLRHPWRPRLMFQLRDALGYVSFGLKTSASQILFQFYTNFDFQVVGWFFGARALGLYTAAARIVLQPVQIISNVVVEVAFPVFSRLRRNRAALVEQLIAFTRMNLATVLPFLSLVLLVADDFLRLFLGPEWVPATPAVRILCIVGVLRALSYIVPPLLDGIGYPSLTLLYTAVAAVIVPLLFVSFAALLGPSVGFVSVAWAWALGYPVAFGVLALLALRRIALGPIDYLRRVVGIPGCTVVALAAGAGVSRLLPPLGPAARMGIIAAVLLAVLGVLLAYTQGISPRSIGRSLSAPPGPPDARP